MEKSGFEIGMVGVGRMGANMARRLKDEGYLLTAVYDIDSAKSNALAEELGCSAAPNPAEVAKRSNTVFTVITDDAAMDALFSESDPFSLLQYPSRRLFINCATLSPGIHREVERRARTRGAQTLEACMASSIPQAREGSLYLMCGGEKAVFERAKPLLLSLARSIRYIGEAGEAAKVKALVNMVMNINTAALAEGLGLGAALGLDLTLLREVFSQTGAASRVLDTDGADMQKREHDCYFSAEHAAKDSGIALKLAEEQRLSLPLAQAAYLQFRRLVEIGKGDWDKSAVAELTFPGRT